MASSPRCGYVRMLGHGQGLVNRRHVARKFVPTPPDEPRKQPRRPACQAAFVREASLSNSWSCLVMSTHDRTSETKHVHSSHGFRYTWNSVGTVEPVEPGRFRMRRGMELVDSPRRKLPLQHRSSVRIRCRRMLKLRS